MIHFSRKFAKLTLVLLLGLPNGTMAQDITYVYDEENRLTRADYGNGNFIEYTYDDVGNRTRRVVQFNLPEPVVTVADARVIEGDAGTRWARFAVSLSNSTTAVITLDFQTSDGSAVDGEDYLAASGTLSLSPGSVQHEILVSITGDTVVEPTESFFLHLSNPTNATLARIEAVAFLEDDDRQVFAQLGAPTGHGVTSQNFAAVQDAWDCLAADDFSLTETTRLTRLGVRGFYSAGGGPVDSVDVFVYGDAGGVPGALLWSGERLLPADADGDFLLDLAAPVELGTGTYWLAVRANMDLAAGGQWFWREQLSGEGSAFLWRNPGDGFGNGCPSWQSGTTCGVGESPALAFELFGTGEPTLSISDVALVEGDAGSTDAVFSVALSGALDTTVQVSYSTADGTATAGSDYESRSGSLVFPPGHLVKTLTVPVLGDSLGEQHETFFVDLSSPVGAPLGDTQGLGTIEDDDASHLSIESAAALEGDVGTSQLVLAVTLDPISSQDVTVSYASTDGTARSGDDFTAVSGTLTFPAGTSTQTVAVTVQGDLVSEVDETFQVTLSNPGNALLGDGEATAWILDDDALVDQTVNSTSSSQSSQNFEAAYDSYDSEAADDFALRQPVVLEAVEVRGTFSAAGPVTSVTVTVYADGGGLPAAVISSVQAVPRDPADPNFVVDLPAPLTLAAGTYWLGVVANMDVGSSGQWYWLRQTVRTGALSVWRNPGDGFGSGCTAWTPAVSGCGATQPDLAFRLLGTRQPSLFVDDVIVLESEHAAALFTVSLTPASTAAVTVDFATTDATALAGLDYEAFSGTLNFAPGETQKTVAVPIFDNGVSEPTETFTLDLSQATGAPVAKGSGEGLLTRELFRQLDASSYYGITAQDFDAENDAFDSQAADDFPIYLDVSVERIEVEGFFTAVGGRTEVQGVDLQLYADAGGGPAAAPLHEVLDLQPADAAESVFLLELPSAWALAPGTYWLSVEANLDYAAGNRRWYWRQQLRGHGATFAWRNPADGFATGCVDWTSSEGCGTNGDPGLSFRLLGTEQSSLFIYDVNVVPGDSGAVDAVVAVHLYPASNSPVTVDFATEDGTAVAGEDYVAQSGTLTFAPGEIRREVRVQVLGSDRYEPTETFAVRLSTASGAALLDTFGQVTLTRQAIDQLSSPGSVGVTSQDFEAVYDAFDSQAADDFTLLRPVTVERIEALGVFAVGQGPLDSVDVRIYADDGGKPAAAPSFSADGLAPVHPYDPNLVLLLPSPRLLGAGTWWLSLEANMSIASAGRWFWRESSASGERPFVWRNPAAGFGAGCADWQPAGDCVPGSADNLAFALFGDVQPGLFVDDVTVTEGDGEPRTARFSIRVHPASPDPVTVDYATEDGTAVAGEDYQDVAGSLSFPAWTSERTVEVPIVGDVLYEPEESFLFRLSQAAGVPLADAAGTGSILDDDTAATLSIGDAAVQEGDAGVRTLVFPVTLSAPSPVQVQVGYTTADATAQAASDYSAASGTLTFPPGTVADQVTVTIHGDTASETTEVFTVTLQDASGAPLERPSAVGTIFDDDALVEAFGTAADFAVASQDVEPLFDVYDTQAADVFVLTEPSRLETVEVDGTLDGFDGTPPPLSSMMVEIYPDSAGPAEPAVFAASGVVPVDGAGGRWVLSLPAPPVLSPGTYWLSVRASLDLADGRWSWRGHQREGASSYRWRNPLDGFGTGCTAWSPGAACDPDATGSLGFRLLGRTLPVLQFGEVQVTEGDAGSVDAVFTVSLSAASDESVTVDFATLDGTASQGEDYQSVSGSLTFTPGSTSRQVTVPVIGDTTDEPWDGSIGASETFLLRFTNLLNAVLDSSDAAVGVILDDDPAPAMSIADVAAAEGDSGQAALVFTVQLASASARQVTVQAATADGTATTGSDYVAVQQELVFAPGTTSQTFTVLIVGDTEPESDETFQVLLSEPTNATLTDASATGSIVNDDVVVEPPFFADGFESGDTSSWSSSSGLLP